MLYVFHGTDGKEVRSRAHALINAFLSKAPEASVTRLSSTDMLPGTLVSALNTQGLFHNKNIIILDGWCALKETRDVLFDSLEEMKQSVYDCIVIEEGLHAAHQKKLASFSEKIEKYDIPKEPYTAHNDFALANAFDRGDRAGAWVELQRALYAGKAPEALHGMLVWKAKQRVIKNADSQTRAVLAELATLPQRAYAQRIDLAQALEQLILSR